MSDKIYEIRKLVGEVLAEAKKKKEKAEQLKYEAKPAGYSYSEALDFSAPLGAYNLYRTQGPVNWGPMTGPGTKIDDRIAGQRAGLEEVLHGIVKEMAAPSAWAPLLKESNENLGEGPWDYLKSMGSQAWGGAKKKAADIAKGAKDVHAKAKSASTAADQEKQVKAQAAATKAARANAAKVVRSVVQPIQNAEDSLTKLMDQLDGDESEQMVARAIDTLSNTGDVLGNTVASMEGTKAAAPGSSGTRGKSRMPAARPTAQTVPAMNVKAR